ncbi:MAG: c-type cytochrome [Planctomycetes bacterium]|nr:c-type cytochrome [Planctomycetota bacterium]
MSRLPLLALVFALPACSRPAPAPPTEPAPSVVIVPDNIVPPAPATVAIPPPRPIPLAAEPCDPKGALDLIVVRRPNCSWRVQYPQGQRLLLAGPEAVLADADRANVRPLVVPLGHPVTFVLTSDGGTNPFDVPTFGISTEAPQGKWAHATVRPTRAGTFTIWSGREQIGTVQVVPAAEFDDWLAGRSPGTDPVNGSVAHTGRQLFLKLQCNICHSGAPNAKAPFLEGLFGTKVALRGGGSEVADEQYIRESIRKPKAKIVEGWEPIMPAYTLDLVTEEEVNALVAYIRSARKPGSLAPVPMIDAPVKGPTIPPDEPRWDEVERIKKKLIERGFDPAEIERLYPRPVAPPPRPK